MNIVAERATVDWDYPTRLTTLKLDGQILDQIELPSTWDRNELFLSMMREFLDGLSRGSAPRITLQDGIDVLQTALGAKKSIRTHQKVFL